LNYSRNITLVASVIYNIFIAESRKKVPRINKLPQAQVSKIQPIKRGYFKYRYSPFNLALELRIRKLPYLMSLSRALSQSKI